MLYNEREAKISSNFFKKCTVRVPNARERERYKHGFGLRHAVHKRYMRKGFIIAKFYRACAVEQLHSRRLKRFRKAHVLIPEYCKGRQSLVSNGFAGCNVAHQLYVRFQFKLKPGFVRALLQRGIKGEELLLPKKAVYYNIALVLLHSAPISALPWPDRPLLCRP